MTREEYIEQVSVLGSVELPDVDHARELPSSTPVRLTTLGLAKLGYRELGIRNIDATMADYAGSLLNKWGFYSATEAVVFTHGETLAEEGFLGLLKYRLSEDASTGILYLEPHSFFPNVCSACDEGLEHVH